MQVSFLNKSHSRIINALASVIAAEAAWTALPADQRASLPATVTKRLERIGFNAPGLKRSANASAPAIRQACQDAPHTSDFANASHKCACDKVQAVLTRGLAILDGFNG